MNENIFPWEPFTPCACLMLLSCVNKIRFILTLYFFFFPGSNTSSSKTNNFLTSRVMKFSLMYVLDDLQVHHH